MPLLSFDGTYSPQLCLRHPKTVFLFGDNLVGFGNAGQACIRHAPNAFGIPTKVLPSNDPEAFFDDGNVMHKCLAGNAVRAALVMSRITDVVVPVTPDGEVSLGLGLAKLPLAAPAIYAMLARRLQPEGEWTP